jgi:hypothetical protein
LIEKIDPSEGVVSEKPLTEHCVVLDNIPYEVYKELKDYFNEEPKEYFGESNPNKSLGLYWELSNLNDKPFSLKAFYYVGYWWVSKEEKVYVRVAPKRDKNKSIDFLAVLKELFEDDEILQWIYEHLDDEAFEKFFKILR